MSSFLRLLAFLILAAPFAAAAQTPFFGTPVPVPGVIEAENFDNGGQGVAYNDTTALNEGGQYRTGEAVDIFTSSGAPGGYVVKNFALGEWMTYTIEVAASGWYDFQVRMASKIDTARFHIEVDGADVTGTIAAPITSTTTWEAYQWFVVKKRVPLTKGTHVMKIVSDAEWVGLDAFNITASAVGTPFSGAPAPVPGIIQAENFNRGGQDVAYNDTTALNEGGQYRPDEAVDVFTSSGSPDYVVKNFATGEWMVYTVEVSTSGLYDIKVRVATRIDTSKFHIEIDGVDVTGMVAVPSTSAETWEAYQWIVARALVPLEAGTRHLAIVSDEQWVGLDAIEIAAPPSTPFSGTPIALPGTFEAEDFDRGGEGRAYRDNVAGNAGGQYRLDESVDIIVTRDPAGGGYSVYNFETGEWLAYTVNVAQSGNYDIDLRTASGTAGGAFRVEIDGVNVTGTVTVPPTGSFGDFQWIGKKGVPLSAGQHVLKLVSEQQYFDVNQVRVTQSVAAQPDFFCTFETGWTQCGFTEQKKADGLPRASIVGIGRHGTTSVRLHTEPGDNNVSGSGTSERDDLRLGTSASYCNPGQEEWWAHSVLFPDDYIPPPSGFGVVFDFHHIGGSGQANFHVDAMPNPTGLRLRGHAGAVLDGGRYQVVLGPVVKNVWYDFVYHVRWSTGADGFFIAWVNGEKKLDHRGPTLYVDFPGCYLKLANYHSPFGQPTSVIHDRVVRGKTAESVSLTPLQP